MKIRVWDLPTRAFHWLFTISVSGAILSVNFDNTELHAKFGYASLVLVVFRILWGFIGPEHARFTNFVPKLSTLKTYLKNLESKHLGHNPLGAFSVIAILGVVLIQTLTGLFADDDISFQGPLNNKVSSEIASLLNRVHHLNSTLIYVVVGLHLAAIIYYQWVKKQKLISAMITGDKEITDVSEKTPGSLTPSEDHWGVRILALVLIGMLGFGFYYLVLAK